jgi:hypothetical protein
MSPAVSQRGISDGRALLQMMLGGSAVPIIFAIHRRNTTLLI